MSLQKWRVICRSPGNVKKYPGIEGICSYRKQILPLPPPPHRIGSASGNDGNFCLVRLWRPRENSTTPPPPHRIWSACGDHGKCTGWHRPGAPPQEKSWLRRWACRPSRIRTYAYYNHIRNHLKLKFRQYPAIHTNYS